MSKTRDEKLLRLIELMWERRDVCNFHWVKYAMSPRYRNHEVQWEVYERLLNLCAKRVKDPRKLPNTVGWYIEALNKGICPVCKSKLHGGTCCYEQDYS